MFKQYLLLFFLIGVSRTDSIPVNSGYDSNKINGYYNNLRCSGNIPATDQDLVNFNMNLEFLEAELFLRSATGKGLDELNSTLAEGGPVPVGAMKANLDPLTNRIFEEFGYQEIGHLRAIKDKTGGIQRPLLNLSKENFADFMDRAVGRISKPRFNPYANTVNFLLAAYYIPYVGLTGYVGTIPYLLFFSYKQLVSGLLAVEAAQDAVMRTLLYERQLFPVVEYGGLTVAELTNRISNLRNELGMCGIKDEGVYVPVVLGAENRTTSNIIAANEYSLAYNRTAQEVLRVMYGSGDEHQPGGFWPCGANGRIARMFLDPGYCGNFPACSCEN